MGAMTATEMSSKCLAKRTAYSLIALPPMGAAWYFTRNSTPTTKIVALVGSAVAGMVAGWYIGKAKNPSCFQHVTIFGGMSRKRRRR